MRIKEYVRCQKEFIAATLCILAVSNIILTVSVPLEKSLAEILYLDLLLLVIMMTAFGLHYYRNNRIYQAIRQQTDGGRDNSRMLYDQAVREQAGLNQDDVMGTTLLWEILDYIQDKFSIREQEYQQKMNDLNDYLTHTVHDIKVNLAVCELAVKRLEDLEIADKLIYQIDQMKFRVSQTLSVVRANHYSDDIMPERIDIGQIVKDAITDNREFFIAKGISISSDVKIAPLVSDQKWVHYIISQILNNCSKYTAAGGEVAIFSKEDENGCHLLIKDNGIGIPAAELSRIFDKGFTGTNGRQGTKSTGMGMHYAKKMADNLGIGLHVASEQHKGTEFTISFYHLPEYLARKQKECDENVI